VISSVLSEMIKFAVMKEFEWIEKLVKQETSAAMVLTLKIA